MSKVVADVSLAHHENAYKIVKLQLEAKTTRQVQKEKIKWRAANEHEQAHLEHKCWEAEAQRAHKLHMLQQQFEFERFHAGLQHAPAGMVPMLTASTPSHAFTPIQPPPSWDSIDP